MHDESTIWISCTLMGLSVAIGSLSGRRYFGMALDGIERDLGEKLRRMRTPVHRLRSYLVVWIGAVTALFLGMWLVVDSVVFAVLFSAFLLASPWYLVRRMTEQRRNKIEDQMADAMVSLANAVRAGLSLPQAMDILAAQCPPPINAEFHQIIAEYKLGKPLDRTLTEAKQRLKSENFALFAAAMLASHESGGKLNETVERIAQSVLELQRLERKIKSETAQARKSAIYMALAPGIILVAYYFVDPVNTRLLFTTTFGQMVLAFCIVLNVIAYFWARTILTPDI